MAQPSFHDEAVREKFDSYPEPVKSRLLELRTIIFDVHSGLPKGGTLVETLKWGQLSYLTEKPKTGSTLRIDASDEGSLSLYFICTTTLVDDFRSLYGDELTFVGNRELRLGSDEFPVDQLRHCIAETFTYNLRKKRA